MKIALVAPLIESVPPALWRNGTGRVVPSRGTGGRAQVTLFASQGRVFGDSAGSSHMLVPAIYSRPNARSGVSIMCLLDELHGQSDLFDVSHFRPIDVLHFPLFRPIAHRTLTTLHGRQDLITLSPVYQRFPQFPMVSISNDQRRPIAYANSIATVYHGLPLDLFQPVLGRAALFWHFSAASRRRRGSTAPSRSPNVPGFRSRSRPRSIRSIWLLRECHRAPAAGPEIDFIGEIGEREGGSSATPARFSFLSIGRSPSAW